MHANTQAPVPPAKKGGLKFKLFCERCIHISMPLIINYSTELCCPWDIGPQKNMPYYFPLTSNPMVDQKSRVQTEMWHVKTHLFVVHQVCYFFILAQHQLMTKHDLPSVLLCRWWCPFGFITMIVIYFLLSKFLWSPRSRTITLCTEKKYFMCGSKACRKWAKKTKVTVQVDHTFTDRKKGRNVGAV